MPVVRVDLISNRDVAAVLDNLEWSDLIGGIGLYDNVKGTVTVTQLDRKGVRYLYYFRLIV